MRMSICVCLSMAIVSWAEETSKGGASKPEPSEAVLFRDIPIVEAASLHAESIQEAPASVTIITADEIRRYGYRTLGEALAATRGFYSTYDRTYHYIGVRGFSLPGDYNTRFLVMLNGHNLTENIYGSNGFFGQDFALDMDLVKRIEVIRGPSSTLYGSNGIFATINIITKSPVEQPPATVSAEGATFGEKKLLMSSSVALGRGANLLVSGSVFHTRGPALFFPEYESSMTGGKVPQADGERGYHGFAQMIWRNWSVTALLGNREKQMPISWGEFAFSDPGTRTWDSRNFVEAGWSRGVGAKGQLDWRISYDWYEYQGQYHLEGSEGHGENRDYARGDWGGSRLTYRFPAAWLGDLTVGAEFTGDIRAAQKNFDAQPEFHEILALQRPDRSMGVFIQQERRLGRRLKASLGARLDTSRYTSPFVSPRLALVYEHSPRTVVKLLYGRAFREPSSYEQFYDDGTASRANLDARPERAHTLEAVVERSLNQRLQLITSVWHYRLTDLLEGRYTSDGLLQFQNVSRVNATGGEAEILGHIHRRVETSASAVVQQATLAGDSHDLPNSPRVVGKLRLSAPLGGRLGASAVTQYLGPRRTLADNRIEPVWQSDITVTSRITRTLDLLFGVRNLFDHRYYDPVAINPVVDVMRQNGRTAFVKLSWRLDE